MGETGVRGESGGSDVRRTTGELGAMARAASAGDGGAETSDSRRGFKRIPPRGAVSGDAKAGLGGMSSEPKVGDTPSEAMGLRVG